MALPVQSQPSQPIEQAFVADRDAFWHRFTGFAKWGTIAVVALLILMWIFLV